MWPATAGINSFLWGQDVKDNPRRRIAIRRRTTTGSAGQGSKSPESDAVTEAPSVIADMWRIYMRPKGESRQSKPARTIKDLDPEIQRQLKEAMEFFNKTR
jgi:hypothetical protein